MISPCKYSCYFKEKGLQITVLVLRVVRNYPVQFLHFSNKELVRDVNWLCRHIYERYFYYLIFLINRKGKRERFKIYTVYIFHHLPLRQMFSGCASLVLSRLPLLGGCSLPLTLLTSIYFLCFTLLFPSLISPFIVYLFFLFPLFQSTKCCTDGEILLSLGRVRGSFWYNDTLCHILLPSVLLQDTQ